MKDRPASWHCFANEAFSLSFQTTFISVHAQRLQKKTSTYKPISGMNTITAICLGYFYDLAAIEICRWATKINGKG